MRSPRPGSWRQNRYVQPWRPRRLAWPEKYASVSPEALEIGMSLGAILAVVVHRMLDAERLEHRLVEGYRTSEVLNGYEDVVEH